MRNFNTIEPGDPYDERELLRFVRRLNASGYFASAQAAIDPNPDARGRRDGQGRRDRGAAEAARRRASATRPTSQFRGNAVLSRRQHRRPRPADADRGAARVEDAVGVDALHAAAERRRAGSARTAPARCAPTSRGSSRAPPNFGTRWHTVEERNERALSATYYLDEQQPVGRGSGALARDLSRVERYWRRTDNLISPTTGWMASLQGGGGIPGVSTRGLRARDRALRRLASDDAEGRAPVPRAGRRGARADARRHPVGAALPHGRRHDGARLRVREPRRAERRHDRCPAATTRCSTREVTHWIKEAWGIAAFVDAGNATTACRTRISRSATAWACACARRWVRSVSTSRTGRTCTRFRVAPFGRAHVLMVETTRPSRPRPQPRRPRRARPRARARARCDVRVAGGRHRLALLAALATETGLAWFAGELVARSGGALEIDGASGTLLDTVRAQRIAWRGTDASRRRHRRRADVAALGAVLARASWSHALGAQDARRRARALRQRRIAAPTTSRCRSMSRSSAWRSARSRGTSGPTAGKIEGLEFGYTGDGSEHRVDRSRLVTLAGTLTRQRDARSAARRSRWPRASKLVGDATLREARVDFVASGTLSALAVDADGTRRRRPRDRPCHARAARGRAARLARHRGPRRRSRRLGPRAAVDADRGHRRREARGRRPRRLGRLRERADRDDLTPGGTPMRALAAHFAWTRGRDRRFDDIDAEIAGGGRATGRSRIALGTTASGGTWHLDVRDVDLRAALRRGSSPRASAGRSTPTSKPARRTLGGTLADRGFAGGISRRVRGGVRRSGRRRSNAFALARGRARLSISGRVELEGRRAFSVDATATKLDPARFGAYPAGSLDAEVKATGTLTPAWRIDGSSRSRHGSNLAGLALGGTARGGVEPTACTMPRSTSRPAARRWSRTAASARPATG